LRNVNLTSFVLSRVSIPSKKIESLSTHPATSQRLTNFNTTFQNSTQKPVKILANTTTHQKLSTIETTKEQTVKAYSVTQKTKSTTFYNDIREELFLEAETENPTEAPILLVSHTHQQSISAVDYEISEFTLEIPLLYYKQEVGTIGSDRSIDPIFFECA
jgi:hypothetical protein